MSQPLTTAVIVTYQSRHLTAQTMQAVKQSFDTGLLECVVVDNASTDGTLEFLQTHHAWAKIVGSLANMGFGRGCNLGLKHATTPYVLFLNPDAELAPPALATLVRFMEEHPAAGAVAPAVVDPQGGLQQTGMLPTPWTVIRAAAGWPTQRPIVPDEPAFQTDWLCGAVLLVRRRLMDELGGFDPRFFLYFEETDLCQRIKQKGAQLWAVGHAVARHVDGAVAKKMHVPLFNGCIAEHYFRSRFYYLVKHHGWPAAACAEIIEYLLTVGRIMLRWLRGRDNSALKARLRAPVLSLPREVS